MESDFFKIRIQLGKMYFSITIRRSEEEVYRAAEKLVNERLNFYAGRYQHLQDETYMMMAMLDIALTLKKNDQRNDTLPIMTSIETLLNEVENAIQKEQ